MKTVQTSAEPLAVPLLVTTVELDPKPKLSVELAASVKVGLLRLSSPYFITRSGAPFVGKYAYPPSPGQHDGRAQTPLSPEISLMTSSFACCPSAHPPRCSRSST